MASARDFVKLNLVGESPVFVRTLDLIARMASCDATALIQGETGTGKELAARAIHYLGRRRDFPFIPVNCAAIPDSLVENELFGHSRGAFTDARDEQAGLIAEANRGTLFLDDVDTLSPRAQASLLRFLQDGTYRRLGGRGVVRGDVRVVAASNADLLGLVHDGSFRQDLYYRLKVLSADMPPLRDREGDVLLLASHFIRRFSEQYGGRPRAIHASLVEYLSVRDWPGNVRELENLLHRQFILADHDVVMAPVEIAAPRRLAAPSVRPAEQAFALGFTAAKALAIEHFERSFLAWALNESGGNISRAAHRVGKERRTFGRLVKKHGLQAADFARTSGAR